MKTLATRCDANSLKNFNIALHCTTVSLAYGGEGPGTVWGKEKALQRLADAGFGDIEVKVVPGDILNYYYYIARKCG
jgi:hypothetical protein